MLQSLFSFILALSILVFLHELGHYLVAKWCGVKVLQFSVGFGKPIYQWVNKNNGERWTIGWIPLGGYVRMLDERDQESTEGISNLECAFNRQSVYRRIAIVLAGPMANLLVAWFIYSILTFVQAQQIATVLATPPEDSIASSLGVSEGDKVVRLNNSEVENWQQLSWGLFNQALLKEQINLEVLRDGKLLNLMADAKQSEEINIAPNLVSQLGFYPIEQAIIISSVQPNSPAQLADLKPQDQILSIENIPMSRSIQVSQYIQQRPKQTFPMTVLRNGQEIRLFVTPKQAQNNNNESIGMLGIGLHGQPIIEKVDKSVIESIIDGGTRMIEFSVLTLVAFKNMITGDLSWEHLSGPVSIASAAGESSSLGILAFLSFLAMVSVSLGILNLLPIPILDGGHLMYYLAEIVMGRPVSDKWVMRGQKVGFALVGGLTCVAIFNDIQRLL